MKKYWDVLKRFFGARRRREQQIVDVLHGMAGNIEVINRRLQPRRIESLVDMLAEMSKQVKAIDTERAPICDTYVADLLILFNTARTAALAGGNLHEILSGKPQPMSKNQRIQVILALLEEIANEDQDKRELISQIQNAVSSLGMPGAGRRTKEKTRPAKKLLDSGTGTH